MKKFLKRAVITILAIIGIGFLIPQGLRMPVDKATDRSYNPKTFWYGNWGSSVVHKGVDIFAKRGTRVNSSTIGIVLLTSDFGKGGNNVLILGPKWRLHYYAHLDKITTKQFAIVGRNTQIGTVGNTGNASKTPAHLHYTIATLIPYPWRIDDSTQGWMKMFYLNPIDYL